MKTIRSVVQKVVLSEKTIRIKLLGDSITHGVGGTGFTQDGDAIVGNVRRNTSGYCWAKLFAEYMQSTHNCEIVNSACTGTTIEFILDNLDALVDDNDDIILCAIGTNNRHQYKNCPRIDTKEEHMQKFYDNLITLHEKIRARSKDCIFISNIPAAAENEKDGEDYYRLFHMGDLNALYLKAAYNLNIEYISLYNLLFRFCREKGITIDSLLSDGLHPNDHGHFAIFELIVMALGLSPKPDGAAF